MKHAAACLALVSLGAAVNAPAQIVRAELTYQAVSRFRTTGYPTMILLDPNGKEIRRVADYMSSKETLKFLTITK